MGRALQRDEERIREWKQKTWPGIKKKAQREGRTIVFLDESGVSQRPHVCRTWSPRGQTPIVQSSFQWKTLSAIAGLMWWNFYFQLYPSSIRSAQVVEFLKALTQHIAQPLLIVWDRLPSHRSKLVWEFVEELRGWIHLEYLPPYAPELNPLSTSGALETS